MSTYWLGDLTPQAELVLLESREAVRRTRYMINQDAKKKRGRVNSKAAANMSGPRGLVVSQAFPQPVLPVSVARPG